MNDLMYCVCKSGYSVLVPDYERAEMSEKQLAVLEQNWGKIDYKGHLSGASSRRIAHILEIWYRATKIASDKRNLLTDDNGKRLVFITLTLSAKQFHTDNEIKRKMLNHFIISLSRTHKLVNYLWKAEKQKNGNIHFHLITDIFIPKSELNHIWDLIQFQNGYLAKSPIFSDDYASPSTRIEIVSSNGQVGSYMGKYMSKTDENGLVEGRVWGASREVKALKDIHFEYDSETAPIIDEFAKKHPEKMNIGDFFVSFGVDFFFTIYLQSPHHRSRINMWYAGIYLSLYGEVNVFNENDLHRTFTTNNNL